ncbi:MAG: lytic transglycosylase domain-containing protein, partial [Burkholderiaceae bacterium]
MPAILISRAWLRSCAAARALGAVLFSAGFAGLALVSAAQSAVPAANDPIVKARAAYQHRDRASLAALRKSTAAAAHPLAMWVDYWELSLRLRQASQADLEAFYARWPDTAVEQRLRRDWIVERGKRGDTSVLALELPRLRAADERDRDRERNREVECYALLQRHAAGQDVAAGARELWFAQREADHGCALLAATLVRAGRLTREDVWARARLAAEQGRRYVAQHAIALLGSLKMDRVRQAFLQPTRFLARRIANPTPDEAELTALAIVRLATRSATAAAAALADARATPLPPHAAGAAWLVVAKEGAMGGRPQAHEWYRRAAAVAGQEPIEATPDALAWKVRAALRAETSTLRWPAIVEAVDAMGEAQRADPTWTYWKARALEAMAEAGAGGEAHRRAARQMFESIAGSLHYYGRLAALELGRDFRLPDAPPELSEAERAQAQQHPSLTRGLALLELRLREEGLSEWQHAIHGMNDRSLRAAAQRACDAQVWNLCMATSERTRTEIDMAQRFPTPYRQQIDAAAREADIDAARVYAVIRQESNFSAGARSVAGAAGLMQVMPLTARWVASRFRIPYKREHIADPTTNVRIGARYLKLVLNSFGGSHAHAAAAYNAGPSRPRRWSKGSNDDTPGWIEIIPIAETRDYVKNVLSNAACYGAMLGQAAAPAVRVGGLADAPLKQQLRAETEPGASSAAAQTQLV